MNTVLVRYGHSVHKKTIYKKPERKIRSESRDIDENQIVQWLGETFGIFCRLAAEWCYGMLLFYAVSATKAI